MMTNTEVTLARARLRLAAALQQDRSPRRCTRTSRRSACRSGSEADQTLAKALQRELKQPRERAGDASSASCAAPVDPERATCGGGSDDIGDVSWNVPTVTLRYPSNIPGLPGHNWANAIAMATPIAHKGVTAGAKVQAMTVLDLLTRPELVQQAWDYFRNVQTKDLKYMPFIGRQGQAGDLAEREDHGEVPAGDEEVLLRPDEVQDLSRAARHQVPDGQIGQAFESSKSSGFSDLRGFEIRTRILGPRHELRRRDEVVEMPPDDLLDDDVRVFLLALRRRRSRSARDRRRG